MFKNVKISIVLLMSTLLLSLTAEAEVRSPDKSAIQDQINLVTKYVNNNTIDSIVSLISPDAKPGLKKEIKNSLKTKKMDFEQSINSYEDLENNRVKVKCTQSATGDGWRVSGMSTYYTFEKHEGSWLINDTDFHKKIGKEFVTKSAGKIFLIVSPIIIILIIAVWKIFTKAGKPGWASIIPIYNFLVLLQIIGKPWWWILLLLIPIVNIIILIKIAHKLSLSFGKGAGFTLGLIFLNIIFLLILAFSNVKYVGPGGKDN